MEEPYIISKSEKMIDFFITILVIIIIIFLFIFFPLLWLIATLQEKIDKHRLTEDEFVKRYLWGRF